ATQGAAKLGMDQNSGAGLHGTGRTGSPLLRALSPTTSAGIGGLKARCLRRLSVVCPLPV
ncbi:MAG: hypothetical protein KAX80_14510, partial [Planctomycetes bacterium]|nr:hypothetical protein [Planctomycetota bacterium]